MPIGTIVDETQYARRVIKLRGSFRINGTTTPDDIKDGKSEIVLSVTRNSAGNFTVTLSPSYPIPRQVTASWAQVSSAAAFTKACDAQIVRDSYSPTARTFTVVTRNLDGTPAVEDPDDNDVISWGIYGPAVDSFLG